MFKKSIFLIISLLLSINTNGQIVDSVYNSLSLDEKIAQLFIFDFNDEQNEDIFEHQKELIRTGIGGIILMDGKMNTTVERINEFNKIAKVPLLTTLDGEWGASMRFNEVPAFPRQMQLGALASDTLVYKMGYLIGKECRILGLNVNFAPDIDINNNPANPVINTRSFGQDREKVARYGAAYMLGMKDAGVAGSAKHFPGHGDTDVDSHLGLPVLHFSRERLDSLELYPFQYLINQEVDMVMVGHLCVPALDSTLTISSISKPIMTDLLKNQMGFKGIVCTDALTMSGLAKNSGLDENMIPLEAFKAGADLLLMCKDELEAIRNIKNALLNGEIKMSMLEEKVKKILNLKMRLGLFDSPVTQIDTTSLPIQVVREDNIALIEEICEKSLTLVWNKESILPLSDSGKTAYIGYGANEDSKPFVQGLIACNSNIDTIFIAPDITASQLDSLKSLLSGYDRIILAIHNADSRPHKDFGINTEHFRFFTDLAAEIPVAVVYFGSPYAIDKIDNVLNFKAFLIAYSNTSFNNAAAAKIVTGQLPPLGVLPVQIKTIPLQ